MVRLHYEEYLRGRPGFEGLKKKTYELCEFLTDVAQVRHIDGRFPYRVGLHQSCHGLRELRLGTSSELVQAPHSKVRPLLEMLEGIEFAALSRPDECCGFGGTFAVKNADTSMAMLSDKLRHILDTRAEVCTAADTSCLMHIGGGLSRRRSRTRAIHLAEILASR